MTKSKRITFRISTDKLQRLKNLAAENNTDVTALIHRALEQVYGFASDQRKSGAPAGNQNAKKVKEPSGKE